MSRLRVGLTGGLAAGKSTVGRLLRGRGFTVVDADEIVARLYRPGARGTDAILALVGSEALAPEGGVDHRAVAARVFGDPGLRRELEAAIHPLVGEAFEALARETQGVVVLEAPLLVESGLDHLVDLVVTVEAPRSLRIERAVARGLDRDDAVRRVQAQTDEATRRARADLVIENSGDLATLETAVDQLAARLVELADAERRDA